MDNLMVVPNKQELIDRYNAVIEPLQAANRVFCPQCLTIGASYSRETMRITWKCGSSQSIKLDGKQLEITGDMKGTATCYLEARKRPIDMGNVNPHGVMYEDLVDQSY